MLSIVLSYISLGIIIIISCGLHEFAHAYVSYKLGDPTPKLQGRLTMNPLKHIDPIGFLMIFFIGLGWGKPVQVNPAYYKNTVKGEILTAFAGPAMNILLSIVGILLMLIIAKILGLGINDILGSGSYYFISFLLNFSLINIGLAVFNMIPLPPLDGYRLIMLISVKFARWIEQYTKYISIVFIVLILFGDKIFGVDIIGNYITGVASAIFNGLFTVFASIFY